ncbi:hypothetical protein HMPREF1548_05378 [Clostridium sp. KLE 1755]|nr:hypothetical protein HMPREF1548_05378 [Clostridium sp. KLE 1755]
MKKPPLLPFYHQRERAARNIPAALSHLPEIPGSGSPLFFIL